MSDIDLEVEEHEAAIAATEKAMEAAGVPTEDRHQRSYFGLDETHKCLLDDGVSYVEHKTLNEGARKRYMDEVNREVAIKRSSGDAVMKMQTGTERHILLRAAIIDWNLIDENGQPIPFFGSQGGRANSKQKGGIDWFLEHAPTPLVDRVEKDIRKHNPWLLQDMSVEDLEKQIEEIQEMIEVKKKEEAGNVN